MGQQAGGVVLLPVSFCSTNSWSGWDRSGEKEELNGIKSVEGCTSLLNFACNTEVNRLRITIACSYITSLNPFLV